MAEEKISLKLGNVSLDPIHWSQQTKEDFIKHFKGKLRVDINKAWKEVQKFKPKKPKKVTEKDKQSD